MDTFSTSPWTPLLDVPANSKNRDKKPSSATFSLSETRSRLLLRVGNLPSHRQKMYEALRPLFASRIHTLFPKFPDTSSTDYTVAKRAASILNFSFTSADWDEAIGLFTIDLALQRAISAP